MSNVFLSGVRGEGRVRADDARAVLYTTKSFIQASLYALEVVNNGEFRSFGQVRFSLLSFLSSLLPQFVAVLAEC